LIHEVLLAAFSITVYQSGVDVRPDLAESNGLLLRVYFLF